MMNVKVFPSTTALADFAAESFVQLAGESIRRCGLFTVALSGGSTPKLLYKELAVSERQRSLAWENIHLFWGDERCVPPDHLDSNYRMARKTLLNEISIPEGNIHRVPAELDARLAAFQYEEDLRGFFEGEWPRFDLVLLGMGDDGHTASLFPDSAGLNEEERWFIANYAPKKQFWRLTLSKNAINAARNILVLVQGTQKADMIANVLTKGEGEYVKPIMLITPWDGRMVWALDVEATSKLPPDLIT